VFGPYLDEGGRRVEKRYGFDVRAAVWRQLEAALAVRHGCPYIANIQEKIIGRRCCWRDRNHPNEYGNRHVADAIEPVLERLLGQVALPVRKPNLATLRDLWFESVALEPERPAVVDGERRLTYGQAHAAVEQVAAQLVRAAGVPAPRVAVFLPNCLEYYLLYWAVVRLGGMVVPLNTWLKAESLAGIFRNVRPDILVVRSSSDRLPLEAAAAAPPRAVIALEPGADRSGVASWDSLLTACEPAPLRPLAPEDVSIVMHTSGTTAVPKGAMMRHVDLMFNVMTTLNAHDFVRGDVHLLVNPMFHCTALYSSLPAAAYTRTPVVIAAANDAARLMELVQRERITTFLSTPAVFQQVLKLPNLSAYDSSSLRVLAYAGSPMPVGAIHRLRAAFPETALHNFFGLTETISMTHVLNSEAAAEHPDSIGRLLPFVEARIADEEGRELPP